MGEPELPLEPDQRNRSASLANLAAALAKAQMEMEGAAKDATNPHFRSKYADLASVRDACKPLSKHGIAVLQPVRADGAAVTVTTLLVHDSGEWISEDLTLTAQQATPQAVGSAITYGRRYGLAAMVGIAPEDDDGEAASKTSATHALVRDWQTTATPTDDIPNRATPRPVAALGSQAARAREHELTKAEIAKGNVAPAVSGPMISEPQAKRFYAIAKKAGWVDRDLADWLQAVWHVSSSAQIRRHDYEKICTDVARGPDADVQA